MDLEHYKAASEATDADERALIPAFKRIRPQSVEDHDCPECGEHFSTCLCSNDCPSCGEQLRAGVPCACSREEKREAWDEAAEHRRDLEHESRETEEREASGYWDCNEGESTTD